VNCHYNFFSGPDDVIQKPIDLPRVITSHQRKFVLTFFLLTLLLENFLLLKGFDQLSSSRVPNLGYMYPWRYICLSQEVYLRLAMKGNKLIYYLFPNIYTFISEFYLQKSLNAL